MPRNGLGDAKGLADFWAVLLEYGDGTHKLYYLPVRLSDTLDSEIFRESLLFRVPSFYHYNNYGLFRMNWKNNIFSILVVEIL